MKPFDMYKGLENIETKELKVKKSGFYGIDNNKKYDFGALEEIFVEEAEDIVRKLDEEREKKYGPRGEFPLADSDILNKIFTY